jgi:hypothetical protein
MPYSVFDVCGLCQTLLARCTKCAGRDADAKSPYSIGFLRKPAIDVPRAEERTFGAPSSMPTTLQYGIGVGEAKTRHPAR